MSDRYRSQDDQARSLAAALAPAEPMPVNILLVDDEPRNLTVLETILDDPGYRLVPASSPDHALLALINEEFALLILDVQMPGMTGFELAQIIKGRKKTAQIPIIFLTAHFNSDEHVLEGYGTGAVDYLQKPVNAAALRSKVAVFAELHRRGRELAVANRALAAEVVERTRAEDELRRWNAHLDSRVAERTRELDASNARLRLATEAMGLGFWLWDLDSDRWSWENDWPTAVLKVDPAQWPGSSAELMQWLEPEEAERFATAAAAAASSGARLLFEGRVLHTHHPDLVLEFDGRLVGTSGEPPTILGTVRDVSERHRAVQELRRSEERYRRLFHSIDEGFCVVDMVFDDSGAPVDFRFQETNSAFHRHSGLGEVAGHLVSEFLADLEPVWLQGLGSVARDAASFRHEGLLGGLERVVELYAFPIQDSGRRLVAALFRDVTETRRAAEALLERERFLTTVTEAARVGIAVIGSDYRYRFVNESFKRLLNTAGPISVGQKVGALNPQRWDATRPSIDRALAGESLSIEFAVRGPGTDESATAMHICAFLEPHTDVNGARTAAVVLVDVSAQKRLEEDLRDADRHKDEFLATLAHELRNPLAPVRNAVGILRHGGFANGQTTRAGEIIERQVKVMARLIDDLMDVARINQRRLELQLAPVCLQDVIELAIEGSRPQIEELQHTLEVVLPEAPLTLMADATRLAQVFTNILTNAAKYTERGGHIVLRAVVADGTALVTVKDNGIGIAPENIERVFEMFSQVEVALARTRGGLGIGLSLAKRLVELHGGRVIARSGGLGQGSEFEVQLPLSATPAAIDHVPAQGQPVPSGQRVLVVDDNRDGAETLAALLSLRGFDVSLAFDGQQALSAADSFRPDIVLLDIGLPKLNGYEVCKAIKSMPWAAATKIVAITGWGDAKSRQAAFDAGFDRHFVKPVTESQVVAIIDELLAGASAPGQRRAGPPII